MMNGGSTTFTFDNSFTQFLAGVASFQLSYGSDDHHVEQMSIQLTTNWPGGAQVNVGANVVLQDASGHNIDLSSSYVTVTVIAWAGGSSNQIVLSSPVTVGNGQQSNGITLPNGNNILQSVLDGFFLSYGTTDHHVNLVEASVSASQSSNVGYIAVTAGMNDASGNQAVNPTATGSLIATSMSAPGFVIVPYQAQSSSNEPVIQMGTPISAAVSFLTGFQVQYPDSDDHHVKAIGAGNNRTWVDPSSSSYAQTNGVWAWMYDDSGNNQDNSNSYASIVVIGIQA
ncbi:MULTISPECIES: hypothetical protein [Paraburkholderia]|uniref:hypothetical protein n=1 Tax=Paraburkholderia TaxID=1822464 RepID=UPI0022572160|nr:MULTISPECIES: hypothetical protein [Paraburkholderia]MCX4163401.1 hypothetical protein [Paraburkholderia megapolitana]MDN7158896.1 hypothetical protein [Paraburkholderia sp. CHISQ3]MDQ6495943.1 hypothetical protein [Paraburkholderia megapolitana]